MNLLLLILAFEFGMSGESTNMHIDNPAQVYYQAEAGIKVNDLIFVIYGIGTSENSGSADWFETANIGFKLLVNMDYVKIGCQYDYDYYTGNDKMLMFMRVESWGGLNE